MKNTYTKEKGPYNGVDEFTVEAESTVFHIGQSYEDEPVPTLVCKQCGGDKFQVGQEAWATAIRCPVCGWESVIHDG